MKIQYESELYHHGIKGQKWGVRKYQNADGSYTAAGRKRYAKQLTKDFNKASIKGERLDYRAQQQAKGAARAQKLADATNRGILKPISKLSSAYSKMAKKASDNYERESVKQVMLAQVALKAAEESGFTAKAFTKPTIVDVKYYGMVTTYVTRQAVQAKFTDPTQPKNRAERREEKDRNRLKNAAYEMDQAKADWKSKQKEAVATVGTNKYKHRDYGTLETWKDPDHPLVKTQNEAQKKSFSADRRFAKEFDAYKKKHPNTDMDLSDWEKKRKKMYY